MRLLIAYHGSLNDFSKGKYFHLKEFSNALQKFGVECKLVSDVEYARGFPSKKLSDWFIGKKQFKNLIDEGAFIQCGWDGSPKTEEKIKKETNATIRCIPFEQNIKDLKCIYTSKKAKFNVIFAKAY